MDQDILIDDTTPIDKINEADPIDKINEVPVIPTAAELEAPQASIPSSSSEMTHEAPYGYNKDGSPAKKRGRKAAGEVTGGKTLPDLDSVTPARPRPVQSSQSAKVLPIAVNYRALGQQAATLWFSLPQIFLGTDWGPEKEEIPLVAESFEKYFESEGITTFSPGFSLALVLGTYALGKATKPTVADKIKGVFGKLKGKLPWAK